MGIFELTPTQKCKLQSAIQTGDIEVLELVSTLPNALMGSLHQRVIETINTSDEARKSEITSWKKAKNENAVRQYNSVLIERQKIDILIDKIYIMSKLSKHSKRGDIRYFLESLTLQGFFKDVDSNVLKDLIEYIILIYTRCGSNICAELIIKLKDARLDYTEEPTIKRVGNIIDVRKGNTTFGYEDTLDDSILLDLKSIVISIFKRLPQENKRAVLWQELTFLLLIPIDSKADCKYLRNLSKDYLRYLLENNSIRKLNDNETIREIFRNIEAFNSYVNPRMI